MPGLWAILAFHSKKWDLNVRERDVVQITSRVDVPGKKADHLFVHFQIARAWPRLFIVHETLSLVNISKQRGKKEGGSLGEHSIFKVEE